MNDGKEWQDTLPEFLLEAEMLLTQSEECLNHLRQFRDDSDAINCLKNSLHKLAAKADAMALAAIGSFCRQVLSLISHARQPLALPDLALQALHDCLNLMAWQLELVDAQTGQLSLDEDEQAILIATAAEQIPQKELDPRVRQTSSAAF